MGNAPFMVLLLEIPVPLIVYPLRPTLDDWVKAFTVQIETN